MRKYLYAPLLLGLAGLAACSKPAPDPAPEPTAEETTAAATPAVANGSAPGTYEVVAADGSIGTSVINADGTYSDMDAEGKVIAEGTWAVVDGKTCFTPTTEGVAAMCFTETAPAEDGSFTATPDEGDPVTVRPKAAAAPGPETPTEAPAE